MRIEGANFAEREASAELIRELMADDAKRGPYMLLMQDGDEESFVQIAFDDHPGGTGLKYRKGKGTPVFHCPRSVSREDAERVPLEYYTGWAAATAFHSQQSGFQNPAAVLVIICGV